MSVLVENKIDLFDEFCSALRDFAPDCLTIEQYWREAVFYTAQYQEHRSAVVRMAKRLFDYGYPLEFLNGESLTMMDTDFLKATLFGEGGDKTCVVSIIGPQSSAKWTPREHACLVATFASAPAAVPKECTCRHSRRTWKT